MKTEDYNWKDDPTVSGISPCDTDTLNDCLMHLKYGNEPNLCPKGTINSTPTGKLLSFNDNILTINANTRTLATGELLTMEASYLDVEPTKGTAMIPPQTSATAPSGSVQGTNGSDATYFKAWAGNSTVSVDGYAMANQSKGVGFSIYTPSNINFPKNKYIFKAGTGFRSDYAQVATSISFIGVREDDTQVELYRQDNIPKTQPQYVYTPVISTIEDYKHIIIKANSIYSTLNNHCTFGNCQIYKIDPSGDTIFNGTKLVGINGNNQPFTTDSIYTQGNLFPKNPIEGQYHLINDPTKFGMWRFVEEVWTQENGVADIVFCGEILLKDGFIEEVKDFSFNSNGFNYNASIISGFSMPSGKYIDLPTVPSGSSFTAPANGYYYISSAGDSVMLGNMTTGMASNGVVIVNFTGGNAWVPTCKGDIVRINYNAPLLCNRFIYAQGEKND